MNFGIVYHNRIQEMDDPKQNFSSLNQGSLYTLELLAARGTMQPNGSISNSVYVNPFDPGPKKKSQISTPRHRRNLRMSSRSRSNDLSNLSLVSKGTSMDNLELNNKLRKSRKNQVNIPKVKGCFGTFYLMTNYSTITEFIV